jgi:hypothetical protein
MNAQTILNAIKTIVGLRNDLQTAIADGAHILPATAAVPATATTPAVAATPAIPTGQLINAAGQAHALAVQLQNHLANIEDDVALLKKAADIIATPATVIGEVIASGSVTLDSSGTKPLPQATGEEHVDTAAAPKTDAPATDTAAK